MGISTPQFTDKEEPPLNIIQENMAVDKKHIWVVHTASDSVLIEQLEKEFVSLFTLGNIMSCVYIVKAEGIH